MTTFYAKGMQNPSSFYIHADTQQTFMLTIALLNGTMV